MAELQTRQQKRAEFALDALKGKAKSNAINKDLANFIVGMPNMILSNGLGQSLAFLKAKSSKPEREFVFSVLKKYIRKEYSTVFTSDDDFDFLCKMNEVNQLDYIKLQDECLRMLEWLKRYARAFQQPEKGE